MESERSGGKILKGTELLGNFKRGAHDSKYSHFVRNLQHQLAPKAAYSGRSLTYEDTVGFNRARERPANHDRGTSFPEQSSLANVAGRWTMPRTVIDMLIIRRHKPTDSIDLLGS
jgi:hypothetical protein